MKKILIIEDEESILMALEDDLRLEGYEVSSAQDGLQGRTKAKEERYDLIILDTPPSRNALDFLEGPSRLGSFLDGRIFQLFLPGEKKGLIRRAASGLIQRVGSAVFGDETFQDFQDFFHGFRGRFVKVFGSSVPKIRQPFGPHLSVVPGEFHGTPDSVP